MIWRVVRQDLERRIQETMNSGGFEARSEWNGRSAVVRCGNVCHDSWNFEVRLAIETDGRVDIKVHSSRDTLTRGKLRDVSTGEPVPQRDFAFRRGDTVGMAVFVRELRKEVDEWSARIRRSYEEQEKVDVAEALRELIGRDPEAAADTLAAILEGQLASYELRELVESVERANREAPSP